MEKECCVRGYHVYSDIWEAVIGKELDCQWDPSNADDGNKDGTSQVGSGSSPRHGRTCI